MDLGPLDFFLSGVIFFTYFAICIISIIFTFSVDLYQKIDAKLNIEVLTPPRLVTFLERNVYWLDNWLQAYHWIAGPLLVVFSLIDMKLAYYILMKFL